MHNHRHRYQGYTQPLLALLFHGTWSWSSSFSFLVKQTSVTTSWLLYRIFSNRRRSWQTCWLILLRSKYLKQSPLHGEREFIIRLFDFSFLLMITDWHTLALALGRAKICIWVGFLANTSSRARLIETGVISLSSLIFFSREECENISSKKVTTGKHN